ncbi:hypothetical protein NO1_0342 [Candidatus Termititenax aidoneus]|uniref:Uncharacterized protein n=1 Tax=Termititenax aidoneus TaxID=2218524 RepID=A0A388T9G6_TERA1|nr:hypothetical protein NO1_0342 [Candidatus Termititenax aidoneus]
MSCMSNDEVSAATVNIMGKTKDVKRVMPKVKKVLKDYKKTHKSDMRVRTGVYGGKVIEQIFRNLLPGQGK